MTIKSLTACASAILLAVTPFSPASAHEHWHGDGPFIALAALGTALVVGTAAILTAPVNAVATVAPPPQYYGPPPQAYYPGAPAPAYYPPAYYAPPVAYAPPVYYAPTYYPAPYYR